MCVRPSRQRGNDLLAVWGPSRLKVPPGVVSASETSPLPSRFMINRLEPWYSSCFARQGETNMEPQPIRRRIRVGQAPLHLGDLLGRAAIRVHHPHLHFSAAIGGQTLPGRGAAQGGGGGGWGQGRFGLAVTGGLGRGCGRRCGGAARGVGAVVRVGSAAGSASVAAGKAAASGRAGVDVWTGWVSPGQRREGQVAEPRRAS